jgi:hypothetical protein
MMTAKKAHDHNRRIAKRDEVFHRTTLRLSDGTAATADIVNISCTGFMARTLLTIEPETHIEIGLPLFGERAARVVWALGGRIGAEFAEPIEPAYYSILLTHMPRSD